MISIFQNILGKISEFFHEIAMATHASYAFYF